jgi:hypothetical protein
MKKTKFRLHTCTTNVSEEIMEIIEISSSFLLSIWFEIKDLVNRRKKKKIEGIVCGLFK